MTIIIARPNEWARSVLMLNEVLIDATPWRDVLSIKLISVLCKFDEPKEKLMIKNWWKLDIEKVGIISLRCEMEVVEKSMVWVV